MEYKNQKLEKFKEYVKNKKIAIIGLGVSNIPLLDYFYNLKSKITVFDDREKEKIPADIIEKINNYSFGFVFGENDLSKLTGFDIIIRSPSCMPNLPELERAAEEGAKITSEIEMLMEMCPGTIIGITGSDGKTTTTSLIYEIVSKSGHKCYLGGNIGYPLFTKLDEMTPDDIIVLELSSFQLMNMKISPKISVITNITPNHLNIHSSYEEYIDAKKNIFKFQDKDGIVVLNYDNEITRKCAEDANGKVIFFSSKEKISNGYILDNNVIKKSEEAIRRHILDVKSVKLRGIHNYENICAALAATESIIDIDLATKAIESFKGVEHRLEFIKEIDGVKWYNDSIGTSPTRTIAGLKSFDEDIILIAGGYDKHLDYTPIAKPILDKVKGLILIGQTAGKIFDAVKQEAEIQNKKIDTYMCEALEDTIKIAKKIAKKGQIVLFSPASASFDMFKNFEERGNKFKSIVNDL